jgi:adenylylsulfate kinase
MLLDGDNLRLGLNAAPQSLSAEYGRAFAERFGLGFGAQDRAENIRRIGAVSQLFCAAGIVTLTAFVSPYRADRDRVRKYVVDRGSPGDFLEVHVSTPLDVCEARDPKGLYKKARAGEIAGFTGISDPYEPPENPELVLEGANSSAEESAARVIRLLEQTGICR